MRTLADTPPTDDPANGPLPSTKDKQLLHSPWYNLNNNKPSSKQRKRLIALLARMPLLAQRDGAMSWCASAARKASWKPGTALANLTVVADLAEHIGTIQFDAVTEDQLTNYLNQTTVTKTVTVYTSGFDKAPSTVSRTYVRGPEWYANTVVKLRTFYKYVYPDAYVRLWSKYPKSFPGRPAKYTRHDLPTAEEVRTILTHLNHPCDRALFAVIAETGMRIGEVVALNVGSFEEGPNRTYQLKIPEDAPGLKTGARNVLAFYSGPILRAWLAHPSGDKTAPMFPNIRRRPGERLTNYQLSAMVSQWTKTAGINKHLHAHLFRAAAATGKAVANFTVHHMELAFGWAPGSSMPDYYSKIANSDVDEFLYEMVWKKAGGPKLPALGLQDIICPNCCEELAMSTLYCQKCGFGLAGTMILAQDGDDGPTAAAAARVASLVPAQVGSQPAGVRPGR